MGLLSVHEILPGRLYTRGKLRQYPIERVLELLAALDIDIVVTLAGPRYEELVTVLGARYLYKPLADGKRPDKEAVRQLSANLARHIEGGRRVLVHCNAGRNRAGLIAAATAARVLGVSGREALALVRSRRPRAVANPAFEKLLEEWP